MVGPPTERELREIAAEYGFSIDSEMETYLEVIQGRVSEYEKLEGLEVERDDPGEQSRSIETCPPEDDPHNAFVTRFDLSGADSGPLDGFDVGIKDNIAVGGVAMTLGSDPFAEFVPARDAEVVDRLLEAGADVVGKTNMESMASSFSSQFSDFGPVTNPRAPDHVAGGSSGGSAAAVVDGTVDVALGTDQGGSVRVPAALCGCVGHKPTFGLVPYDGAGSVGPTFDHIGPLARTVEDCARTLDVISGDRRTDVGSPPIPATNALSRIEDGTDSLTVGVLEEGFGHDGADPDLEATVRDALAAFEEAGHELETVSVPWHREAPTIFTGLVPEIVAGLIRDDGLGYYRREAYFTEFGEAFAQARAEGFDAIPAPLKVFILLGRYAMEEDEQYHARAENLRNELTARYTDRLEDVDVLAMPTTPRLAHELVEDPTTAEEIELAGTGGENTMPFNLTGHPAASVPCGSVDGLPVGLMLVGRHFDDETVLEAAAEFERTLDVTL